MFLSLFDVSFFSFFNGQRFLMAEGVKTKTILVIKLIFHQCKREETVMIAHNKLAFDQRDYRLVKRST